MKCPIFEEHSSSCVVYSRFSGTLFPVSMIDGVKGKKLYDTNTGSVKLILERASLIETCWGLNCEILRNAGHFGPGLICLGLFHPNLGGGSFQSW